MSKPTIASLQAMVEEKNAQIDDLVARIDDMVEQARSSQMQQIADLVGKTPDPLLAVQLQERDAKIAALEAQLAASSRPVARVESPSVKALPILAADPQTRKAVCPLDAEHGSVTPNVKGRCPQCFTEATRAAAMATYQARAAA